MEELSASEYQGGVLAIEQSRAIQEVQAQMVIAKRFPRDEIQSRARIRKACERKSLAEVAEYVYPKGGAQITGASIRLVEVAARHWGNINYGLQEVTQVDGSSDVIAFAWDLETNTKVMRQFKVMHRRKAHGSYTNLDDPREIYEMVANQGQRRVRACILELIPGDIIDEAVEVCHKTLKDSYDDPIEDRIVKMLEAFDKVGVSQAMLEDRLGHPMGSTIEQELANLRKIYASIQDGIGKREDFFKVGALGGTPDNIGKSLDETTSETQGGENPYRTQNGQHEELKCPHCDFEAKSERGLKKHITQSHSSAEKKTEEKRGVDPPSENTQSVWHDDEYFKDQIMPFAEDDQLGLPAFNRVLAFRFNAKTIDDIPAGRREEAWGVMSQELDAKNEAGQ